MRDPFGYIPPNARTAPLYAAIRAAHVHAIECCTYCIEQAGGEIPAASLHETVSDACRKFHDAIEASAPPSPDTSAALRCVRLARMAANEAIVLAVADSLAACAEPGVLHAPDGDINENVRRCLDNLIAARWQACAAIALGVE